MSVGGVDIYGYCDSWFVFVLEVFKENFDV